MMHLKVRASVTTTATSSIGGATGIANPPSGSLLRTPMATLLERVTERRVIQRSVETAAKERAAAAATAGDSAGEEADQDAGATTGSRGDGGGGGGSKGKLGADGALWVDKYAPDGFRDLLSDEKINREVLRAVKAWDPFVFKKEVSDQSVFELATPVWTYFVPLVVSITSFSPSRDVFPPLDGGEICRPKVRFSEILWTRPPSCVRSKIVPKVYSKRAVKCFSRVKCTHVMSR